MPTTPALRAGEKQPIHWFLGGKGLGIQQGTNLWVGLLKSSIELLSTLV
jgi:hypothetical protein